MQIDITNSRSRSPNGRHCADYGRSEIGRYLTVLLFGLFATTASAQRYGVGDTVENFTLIDRATNQEVSLYDLEGKVIFLEWFAYWCPFCQAAAGDIGPGIVDYYNNLGETPNGVEVKHIGLNLQGGAEAQTQNFVTFYGIQQVLNGFDRAVSNRFQPSNQPIFAIINGVANSPNHKQWELLYTELGYGDLSAPIATFRAAIESVQAGIAANPPEIATHPTDQIVESGSGVSLTIFATSDETISYQWKRDEADIPGATSATFALAAAKESDAGQYSVTVTTASGSVSSEAATVEVILGYLDSLIAQGIPEELRGFDDEPDQDGASNAFEFLSRTDASDPGSFHFPEASIQVIDEISYLVLSYAMDSRIHSIAAQAEFSLTPTFASKLNPTITVSETDDGDLTRFAYRVQSGFETNAQFARMSLVFEAP